MLQPSPAGGSGELFPSPAKGHYDTPRLTGAQGAEAQALVDAALSGYYKRGETDDLLGAKQDALTGSSSVEVDSLTATGSVQAGLVKSLSGYPLSLANATGAAASRWRAAMATWGF